MLLLLLLLSFLMWLVLRRKNTHTHAPRNCGLITAGNEVAPHYHQLLVNAHNRQAAEFHQSASKGEQTRVYVCYGSRILDYFFTRRPPPYHAKLKIIPKRDTNGHRRGHVGNSTNSLDTLLLQLSPCMPHCYELSLGATTSVYDQADLMARRF